MAVEVGEGVVGGYAASWSALDKPFLDEEWLIHLLDSAGILVERSGEGGEAHRSAAKLVDDGREQFVVHLVEAARVDVERLKSIFRYFGVDFAASHHLGEVAHAAQQRVCHTWRAAAAQGNLVGGVVANGHIEQPCRALDDALEHLVVVVLQVAVDAKSCTQGCCEQSAACGGTNEGEWRQGELHRACTGALVNHDVDAVVLHCRVEVFLHDGAQAVNLVDEEHIVLLERGEQSRQVARLVEHGPAGHFKSHSHLVGNNARQSGLSQSWRSIEQRVVECLASLSCSSDKDLEIVDDAFLPGKVAKPRRPQSLLKIAVDCCSFFSYVEVVVHNILVSQRLQN